MDNKIEYFAYKYKTMSKDCEMVNTEYNLSNVDENDLKYIQGVYLAYSNIKEYSDILAPFNAEVGNQWLQKAYIAIFGEVLDIVRTRPDAILKYEHLFYESRKIITSTIEGRKIPIIDHLYKCIDEPERSEKNRLAFAKNTMKSMVYGLFLGVCIRRFSDNLFTDIYGFIMDTYEKIANIAGPDKFHAEILENLKKLPNIHKKIDQPPIILREDVQKLNPDELQLEITFDDFETARIAPTLQRVFIKCNIDPVIKNIIGPRPYNFSINPSTLNHYGFKKPESMMDGLPKIVNGVEQIMAETSNEIVFSGTCQSVVLQFNSINELLICYKNICSVKSTRVSLPASGYTIAACSERFRKIFHSVTLIKYVLSGKIGTSGIQIHMCDNYLIIFGRDEAERKKQLENLRKFADDYILLNLYIDEHLEAMESYNKMVERRNKKIGHNSGKHKK